LYSSRRCENKGQDTRYWGNYGRRGCANFYMERLCKLLYGEVVQTPLFPVQGHAWSPTLLSIMAALSILLLILYKTSLFSTFLPTLISSFF
jgi:hypothetical protein